MHNRALPGVVLIAVGAALNAVVVSANGAMPVSEQAAIGPVGRRERRWAEV